MISCHTLFIYLCHVRSAGTLMMLMMRNTLRNYYDDNEFLLKYETALITIIFFYYEQKNNRERTINLALLQDYYGLFQSEVIAT